MPWCSGRQRAQLVPDLLGGRLPQSWPRRSASSQMMWMSSRAWPGGSSALRTRCTRRSELVTVPSDSHQAAAAGSTTSASSAVAVRKMSCTTRWSRPASRCRACAASASDSAGFSPMSTAPSARPRPWPRTSATGAGPCFGGIGAPQAASNGARASSSSRSWNAGQLVGDGAHVAAALHVVLAAQRDQAGAVAADVAGEQRQVDQREHVVGRVVVLGDAEGPADLRPVGAGVGVRQLADQRRPARR